MFDKQIRFSISPIIYNKLTLRHREEVLLHSRPTFSGEASLSYYHHIGKNFGVNIGGAWSIIPYNLNYRFYAPFPQVTSQYPHDYHHYEYFIHSLSIPISLQKIFPLGNKFFYSVEAGVRFTRIHPFEIIGGAGYYIDSTTSYELFSAILDNVAFDYPLNYMGYIFKTGLVKMTKETNTFHLNLTAHYCPQKIGGGWYRFYNLPYESYGTIEMGMNYIGLEFAYGLTASKRLAPNNKINKESTKW